MVREFVNQLDYKPSPSLFIRPLVLLLTPKSLNSYTHIILIAQLIPGDTVQ